MFQIPWFSFVAIGMLLSFGLGFLDISTMLVGGGLKLSMITICSFGDAVLGVKSFLPSVPVSWHGFLLVPSFLCG